MKQVWKMKGFVFAVAVLVAGCAPPHRLPPHPPGPPHPPMPPRPPHGPVEQQEVVTDMTIAYPHR